MEGKKKGLMELAAYICRKITGMTEGKLSVEHVQQKACDSSAATYVLQRTEDQMNTSMLSTDSDGYSTASTRSDSDRGNRRRKGSKLGSSATAKTYDTKNSDNEQLLLQLDNNASHSADHASLEKKNKIDEKNVSSAFVPKKLTDQLIVRDENGQLKLYESSVNWQKSSAKANADKCVDCAAQINIKDVTEHCSENETARTVCSRLNSATMHTSRQEKTTDIFENCKLESKSNNHLCNASQQDCSEVRDAATIWDASNMPENLCQSEVCKQTNT